MFSSNFFWAVNQYNNQHTIGLSATIFYSSLAKVFSLLSRSPSALVHWSTIKPMATIFLQVYFLENDNKKN
jgi:hypothetical protein